MEVNVVETTAEALIEKIQTSYAKIMRLYQSVPVSVIVSPVFSNGWSVKDTLAHIASWEWRCALLLEASHDSNAPLKAEPDVAALNHEAYQERKNWSWEEVEYDFRAAHRTLLEAIRQLPPERLADEIVQHTIAEETWQHYEEHLTDLQRWHKLRVDGK